MKSLLLILFICLIFCIPGKSQNQQLPEEIQQYYKTKNFICSYTTKSERDYIIGLYLRDQKITDIQDCRVKRIAYLLFSTWLKYFHPVFTANNGKDMMPPELLLPDVYKIYKWERDGNQIWVTVTSYIPGDELIHKIINSYSPDLTPATMKSFDFSKDCMYQYQQVHNWHLVDGHWIKIPLSHVLIN